MKRQFYLVWVVLLAVLAVSCAGPKGLSVAKSKNNDMVVHGINNVKGYDPSRQVLMADSLYLNGPPDDSKITAFNPNKNGDIIIPDGMDKTQLPKYLFQVKDGLFNKDDYLWAAGLTSDYKIQTLMSGDIKNGQKANVYAQNLNGMAQTGPGVIGNERTFNVFGSEIMAAKGDNNSTAFYEPCRLSFMLNGPDSASMLVQFSYNNQDMQFFDLNNPALVQRVGRYVKVVNVDLKYGNHFTFVTAAGKFPDLSPEMVEEGKVKLTGVRLSKNEVGTAPFFVLEIPRKMVAGDEFSVSAPVKLSNGYQKLKLPFARKAKNSNYPNGYIQLDCAELWRSYRISFITFVTWGAIGFDKSTGQNQLTVRVSPETLKLVSPELYEQNKNKIIKPK